MVASYLCHFMLTRGWFHIPMTHHHDAGLAHDVGKIIHLKGGVAEDGTSMDTQWGIVGDTYFTGCQIPDTIVFPEFNVLNADMSDARFNSTHGVYTPGMGFRNAVPSFGCVRLPRCHLSLVTVTVLFCTPSVLCCAVLPCAVLCFSVLCCACIIHDISASLFACWSLRG